MSTVNSYCCPVCKAAIPGYHAPHCSASPGFDSGSGVGSSPPPAPQEATAGIPGGERVEDRDVAMLRSEAASMRKAHAMMDWEPPPQADALDRIATRLETKSLSQAQRRAVLEEVRALEYSEERRGIVRWPGVWSAAAVLLGELEVEEGKGVPMDEAFKRIRSHLTAGGEGNPMPDSHTPGDLYNRPPNTATTPVALPGEPPAGEPGGKET